MGYKVLEDLKILTAPLIPSQGEAIVMSIGAILGGALSFILGGIDVLVIWLFCFCVTDYILGNVAVLKLGKWRSNLAYRGIFKKAFMFIMVMVCHGADQTLEVNFIRDSCIFAYILNEVGSILENVERLGFGDVIPPVIKNALEMIRERTKGNEDKKNLH